MVLVSSRCWRLGLFYFSPYFLFLQPILHQLCSRANINSSTTPPWNPQPQNHQIWPNQSQSHKSRSSSPATPGSCWQTHPYDIAHSVKSPIVNSAIRSLNSNPNYHHKIESNTQIIEPHHRHKRSHHQVDCNHNRKPQQPHCTW